MFSCIVDCYIMNYLSIKTGRRKTVVMGVSESGWIGKLAVRGCWVEWTSING
jgi:hypothetical protein